MIENASQLQKAICKRKDLAEKVRLIDNDIDTFLLSNKCQEDIDQVIALGSCGNSANDHVKFKLQSREVENWGGHLDTRWSIQCDGCSKDGHGCCCNFESFSLTHLLKKWLRLEN